MKKTIILFALIFIQASGLRADEGCDKSSDACKPQIKKVTPFMAELQKAQAAPSLKQSAIKEPSLKQAGPEERLAVSTAPAAAPAAPIGDQQTVSHPTWLLAGAGLLIGLYYFLRETKKKGKNR